MTASSTPSPEPRARQRARKLVPAPLLRQLGERSDRPGLRFAAGHLAALALGALLIHATLGTPWVLPAMVIQGIVIVHLFAPFHESTHGTAFKTRWLNQATAWFTGLALGLPPTFFRLEHNQHHVFTQDPAHDPEIIPHTATRRGYLLYATGLPYFRGLLSALLRHPFGRFTPMETRFLAESTRPQVIKDARIMWAVYGAVLLASLVAQSWAAVLFWLLPRILGEPFMRLIRMSEHGACPFVADMLRNTRTVRTLTPLRWLNWNNAFHAEHHAIPGVPFHALPRLHEQLGPHLENLEPGYVATQRKLLAAAAG
jgi:fatty acid desaturase